MTLGQKTKIRTNVLCKNDPPGYIALLILSSLFHSCKKDAVDPIAPSEFTKAQQEELGDAIHNAILQDQSHFRILPNAVPYDTTVYWMIQKFV